MDRLTRLQDTRDRLADAIKDCDSARDLAGLSREYRQCLAEIELLEPSNKEVSRVDEIARRRAARSTGTPDQGDADGTG